MKSNLRHLVLAASTALALPAGSAELPKATGNVPPVIDAIQSAAREWQRADDPLLPLPAQLERMAAFRHTPETADKLRKVFGTDRPYALERQPAKAGRQVWRFTLQPLHYASQPGSGVDWDPATLDFTLDKTGTAVDLLGRWNTLSAQDATTRVTMQGMSLSGRQKRGYAGLWFGSTQVRVARVQAETKGSGTMTMDDLRFDWRTLERPQTVDIAYDSRIGAIVAAGERVEDVHVAVRVTNLDKKTMAEMKAATDRQRAQPPGAGATPEQRFAALKPILRSFGKSALAHGTALEIDEISARYHGNKATVRGRVSLAGAVESDLDDAKALVKKIVAKFEIRVPMAIVRDIAGAVAAKQAAQQGTAANVQGTAQLRQTMTDVIVGKLVGGGYARIENDVLVSNLEFRDGVLRVNGKEVGLPKPAAGQPRPAAPRSNLPPDALQARRIEDSCRLPEYPEEIVRQDQPLRASFAYRVDAGGNVRDARVAAASGFPAWDQAALDALGQCRYIPALQGGKPIELQMNWDVVREAGSRRPPEPNPGP
jgi:TonB family protein